MACLIKEDVCEVALGHAQCIQLRRLGCSGTDSQSRSHHLQSKFNLVNARGVCGGLASACKMITTAVLWDKAILISLRRGLA